MLKKSQTTLGCNVLLKLNIGHFYVVVRFRNNIDKNRKRRGKKHKIDQRKKTGQTTLGGVMFTYHYYDIYHFF